MRDDKSAQKLVKELERVSLKVELSNMCSSLLLEHERNKFYNNFTAEDQASNDDRSMDLITFAIQWPIS